MRKPLPFSGQVFTVVRMSSVPPTRASSPRRFDAAGTALLMPADSGPEIAILLTGPTAPSGIALEFFGRHVSYVRMRQGPLAHGMVEPYREGGDQRDRSSLRVTQRSHEVLRFVDGGRLFGAADTSVLAPRSVDGDLELLSLPINPIGAPRRALLHRVAGSAEPSFRLLEELEDAGWVCPICGRISPNPEPHTAEHGVPGHLKAGVMPGESLDETNSYSAS